ncbi:SGNH/GDSL hydrolase family protein [Kitasatospora griseola]|uniref:SGNH/GDSL hydrolase family protein n=1 Tax=Kitasatospora griseola TaxID=2064 RepID=UPI0036D97D69
MATNRTQPVRWQEPHHLSEGKVRQLLTSAPWGRFVVLGDSVAAGAGDHSNGYRSEYWADRVAAMLRTARPGLAYLNLGRRGVAGPQVRSRQLTRALAFRPDLAAIAVGRDDMLGGSFDAEIFAAELSRIIAPLRAVGCDVLTFGLFDISRSRSVPQHRKAALREQVRLLSERTEAVARRHGAIHVDLTTHPAGEDPGLYSKDGNHPTVRGHAIAAASVIHELSNSRSTFSLLRHTSTLAT